MHPIEFDGCNVVFGEGQEEYKPLPAFKSKDGIVVTCWKMPFFQRVILLFTGKVWLTQSTFNDPLQPVSLTRQCPITYETVDTES